MKLFKHVSLLTIISCISFLPLASIEEEVQPGATLLVKAENNDAMTLTTDDLNTLQAPQLIATANQLLQSSQPIEESGFVLPIKTLAPLKALLFKINMQQINFSTIQEIPVLAEFLSLNLYGQLSKFFAQLAKENMPAFCKLYNEHLIENTGYLEELLLPYLPFEQLTQLGQVNNKDRTKGHTGRIAALALSQNDNTLISGSSDGSIIVWQQDLQSGQWPFFRLSTRNSQDIKDVAASKNGNSIVGGSMDYAVIVWQKNIQTGRWQLYLLGEAGNARRRHTEMVTAVAVSEDGNTIVSGSRDQSIIVWQKNAQTQQWQFQQKFGQQAGAPSALVLSKDGNTLISCSFNLSITVWQKNPQTSQWQLQDTPHKAHTYDPIGGHTAPATSLALSDDGYTFISGSQDRTIIIWQKNEAGQWQLQDKLGNPLCNDPEQGHTNWVTSVALSKDGNTIMSGSLDGTIKIWHKNPQTDKWYVLQTLGTRSDNQAKGITAISLSADENTLFGASGRVVTIWHRKSITDFCRAQTAHAAKREAEEAAECEPSAKRLRT